MNSTLIYFLLGLFILLLGVLISWLIFKFRLHTQEKDFQNEKKLLEAQLQEQGNRLTEIKQQFAEQAGKRETDFAQRMENLEEEKDHLQKVKEDLRINLERRNTEYVNLQEKLETQKAELEKLEKKLETSFENLANSILDKKSEKFTNLNRENIENLLTPLREKISSFEEKVEKREKESVKRHAELGQQLKDLNEQNVKISEEAINLTNALKRDTRTQGNWGELILERVLERSGLKKGSEYTVQESFTTEEGRRLRPDVVIHLPGNRKMIVDSKVSLTAYERYANASEEKAKEKSLKAHLDSVRRHIKGLSQKNYQHLYEIESPNFVLLFIPIEAAFAVASNADSQLYGDAFDKNIVLVTPTTLLAVLGTVDSMWQNEKQTNNAVEIAKRAGKLYDAFVNLTITFEKMGKQLNTVHNTYDSAMKRLTGRGNLAQKVERLKKLGAKTSKQLDQRYLE